MRRFMLALLSIIVLSGCDLAPHTTTKDPDPKSWTAADIDAAIGTEQRSIYSPAPMENGQPPAECDYIRYMVLAPKNASPEPDAVLLLSPGMTLGMGAMSHLARNLIYMAKADQELTIKVIIVERRGNCLEDLSGTNAAEEVHDIQEAIDYYYHGKSIGGKSFQGFVTSDEAPYLSEFGIKLYVEDIYTIITTEVPDPETRRQKLFLAGHSISGFSLGAFAGWDFDGNPATLDDAGYRNCAGLIALDTMITPPYEYLQAMLQIFPEQLVNQLQSVLLRYGYDRTIAKLRHGEMPRILTEKQSPEFYMLLEMAAMQADWHPNQESTVLTTVPYSDDADQYLTSILSGTYRELRQPGAYKRIRCTNLAMSGLLFDNNFYPMNPFSLSMGFIGNGNVAEKNYPIPNMLELFPALTDLLTPIIAPDLYYPTQKNSQTLYEWINFDEILASRFATPADEVVDIYDFLNAAYAGPSNFFEWYFPNRHLIDILSISENGWRPESFQFRHDDFVEEIPILNFFCEYGIITPYTNVGNQDYVYLKGHNHADILMAAANRPELRPNGVIAPLIEFMLSHSRQ